MLRPQQTKQIVVLGFLLLAAVAMLALFPVVNRGARMVNKIASTAPAPAIADAPPPPPSPYPEGTVVLNGALKDVRDLTPLGEVDKDPAYLKLVEYIATQVKEDGLRESAEGQLAYGTFIKHG